MKRITGKFVLKSRINKYIKKLPIDERFKPIVADIVLRRAAQYNRNYGELRADLEALVNNLERVRIVERSKMAIHNYALAVYLCADKEILLSEDILKEPPERIYQVLAHELFHVMLKNSSGIDKFDKFNYMLSIRSNLYQELVAEKGSYRLVYPVENDLTGYNANAFGYEDICFIFDFIEAAYGVNEQDLLKNSLNGRYELAKFLAGSVGEEIYEAEEFLDELEVGGTLLLSSLYDDRASTLRGKMTEQEVQDNVIAGMDSMFSLCQSKIEDRLICTDVDSLEEIIELKEQIAFSEYRLINILKNRLQYFHDEIDLDIDDLWEKCLENYASGTVDRLCDMEQLLNDKEIKDENMKFDCTNIVRKTLLDDDDFYKRFLTSRIKKRKFKISRAYIDSKKEHPIYTEGWKNKKIIKIIEGIVESERANISKKHAINLRYAYEAQLSDKKTFFDEYKLSDEEMKTYMNYLQRIKDNDLDSYELDEESTNKIDNEK